MCAGLQAVEDGGLQWGNTRFGAEEVGYSLTLRHGDYVDAAFIVVNTGITESMVFDNSIEYQISADKLSQAE